jgi:hypothetical protein
MTWQPTLPSPHLQIHKNWMPLVVGGTLYLVTHAQPLTVIKPDLDTGCCEVISRETAMGVRDTLEVAEAGGGASAGVGPPGGVLAASRAGGAASGGPGSGRSSSSLDAAFRAVLGGRHVHGGAPFVEVGPDRFLR